MFDRPFHSPDQFRAAFLNGLSGLLRDPDLGSHILTHANAIFDEQIYASLRPALRESFNLLADRCRDALLHGFGMGGSTDDQMVFLKLMAIGFEGLHTTEFRRLQDWELQFNHIRSFRPARMSEQEVTSISLPFNEQDFHFNKPHLRKEVFWAGEILGVSVELLYNKFPFVPLHGLLVPDREAQHPQLLNRRYHEFIWSLSEHLAEQLPGWGVGYNSFGASASVNHLHFQSFIRQQPLPITEGHWQHNGGNRVYPLACETFTGHEAAWERLETLHASQTSYNLIYLPGRLYCLPRKPQGSFSHATWSNGLAWYELAGCFTAFRHADFDSLDDEAVGTELSKLAVMNPGRTCQPPSSHSSR
ncbi:MAG: hypothetical protein KZQ77_03240 [Candidatus Thiodiazotropha sp. (ex Notomyrtea botanica)]|nr:hypothetical protein [Candidatus Thiodiazotropha sp. (ex Notomyrtea botanica)]